MNLKVKLRKALLDARTICEQAEKEGRDFTADERKKVQGYMAEAAELKTQIKQADDDEALKAALLDFEVPDAAAGKPPAGTSGAKGTLGNRFVESPEFKDWLRRIAPSGQVPDSMKGINSPPVLFKSLKTLVTGDSATSAGAFVETDYTGIYEPLGRYPRNVMGLVAQRVTGSDLVQFVRQTTKVQEAAPVAEANVTTYAAGTGEVEGKKPEGAIAFEQVTEAVKTIAVWVPATKRALSDAAQIRGIIDQELQDDLAEEMEDQLLNGAGTGENFTGILETAGIQTQAWDTDLLTTIRKARTAISTTGRSRPSAIVVHPNDAETLDLLTDDSGRFYFGGPAQGGVGTVWRVPVVESEAIDEGTGLMGDFRKAVLWNREQASIQVSDSHSDFFIRNMVAILAEMRAAFGVIRPTAFCEIEMESGT